MYIYLVIEELQQHAYSNPKKAAQAFLEVYGAEDGMGLQEHYDKYYRVHSSMRTLTDHIASTIRSRGRYSAGMEITQDCDTTSSALQALRIKHLPVR